MKYKNDKLIDQLIDQLDDLNRGSSSASTLNSSSLLVQDWNFFKNFSSQKGKL